MPSFDASSAVGSLVVSDSLLGGARIALPRPEVHLVVRIGSSADGGLDVHAMGARQRAHRKHIRGGQRALSARLRLDAAAAVLGVPVAQIAGRTVALEELWGSATTRQLREQMADARDTTTAAAVLERAIATRFAAARMLHSTSALAMNAATRLVTESVTTVADRLGLSERHLRRIFREAVGVSPKTFAKLARFHRALHAAQVDPHANWARIAVTAGYYDQAHLIADFHALAGVAPRALLTELRASEGSMRTIGRAAHAASVSSSHVPAGARQTKQMDTS